MARTETHPDSPAVPQALAGVAFLFMLLFFAALLFVPAGRLDWKLGWAYVGILAASVAVNWLCLSRWNPELIDRRMHVGDGTKTWDKVWGGLFAPVMLAIYVIAGLEARDGVSSLPASAWPLGLAIFVPGAAMFTWSMVVNPFFEKTVRIQTENDHRVIDTGPYGYVRHPGYSGFAGWIFASP